jgi:hypothetical protein
MNNTVAPSKSEPAAPEMADTGIAGRAAPAYDHRVDTLIKLSLVLMWMKSGVRF